MCPLWLQLKHLTFQSGAEKYRPGVAVLPGVVAWSPPPDAAAAAPAAALLGVR